MQNLFSWSTKPAPPSRQSLAMQGTVELYRSGDPGQAWRLAKGIVRLDATGSDGERRFASLAIPGDILGCETMLFGTYTFTATALTDCRIDPWPEGSAAPSGESLLASLAQSQRRAAELVALRGGQAKLRVLGLMRLLADEAGRVILPPRQDIADITDLRLETISRIVKQLEQSALLRAIHIDGVPALRSYALSP